MNIERVVVGELSENCYIVSQPGRRDALVIDPGAQAEKIRTALGGRSVAAVLLTHGHFDHTGALSAFADAPIYMHPADEIMLTDAEWSVGARFGDTAARPAATHFVQEGDVIARAGMEIRVWHLPGHTPGGVGYRIGDALFAGDTLFRHGYGRCDQPGGNFHALMQSLRRLLKYDENLTVYPGHGERTTLFAERGREA